MNQLRIISGIYGGRLVNTPGTRATHPMGERERGAIFNALQFELKDSNILDAFAGSGAIGLEALSRGAEQATFLEKDKKALRILSENIAKLNLSSRTNVIKHIDGLKGQFDIIFADPPYENPQYKLVISLLDHLKPGGIFVLSHPQSSPPPMLNSLLLLSDKAYANAQIKIYKNRQ
jgi:16S rRNA (guanine966-N2)-methyltransferase